MTLSTTFRASLSRYLSSDLLDKLPDTRAMQDSIQHLNSLHTSVKSFLPLYIAEDEERITHTYGALRPGTFMFSDVSGFTALTEALQRAAGSEGTETLTEIINKFFATMLEIVARSDGHLLKFAGDALLTFFPADDANSEAQKAIRTGLRMQRAMIENFQPIRHDYLTQHFGPNHGFQLTMSVGLSKGRLFENLIGTTSQRDHTILGDLPGMAMNAEAAGEKNDVIIDAQLREAYKDTFETQDLGDGFYCVLDTFGDKLDDYEFQVLGKRRAKSSALFNLDQENLLETLSKQLERVDRVAHFVAPDVITKLVTMGGQEVNSENRLTTTMFVHVTGFAELLQQWGEEELPRINGILSRYYILMQHVIAAQGGALTRTDPYQLGIKLLITFGATINHPDDPDRAVAAALEMNHQLALFNQRLLEELPPEMHRSPFITQRMGITQGQAFAGLVGWKAVRREYTVMGDDVNLAARLMSKAQPGQILISSRVWERVRNDIETEKLTPFQLKGKSQPTQAYAVLGHKEAIGEHPAITSDTAFIGHDLILLLLAKALQQARGPARRRAIGLYGDAGVGKTRIARQIIRNAEISGFQVAWATCQFRSDRKSTWRMIISQLLGLESLKNDDERRDVLRKRLREFNLIELDSVLNDLLFDLAPAKKEAEVKRRAATDEMSPPPGVSTDIFRLAAQLDKEQVKKSGLFGAAQRKLDNNQTKAATDEQAIWKRVEVRTSLADAVSRLIAAFTNKYPTLIVIDDLHQENNQALPILKKVLTDITHGHLVILVTYEPVSELGVDIQAVSVPDLRDDETYLMAGGILRVPELGPKLSRLVWERTRGRPLFIESLLVTLVADSKIELVQGVAELRPDVNMADVPDDVRELIMSRIDRLPAESQAVLRVAAVLGADFSQEALAAVGEHAEPNKLAAILHDLLQAQILVAHDQVYNFRHGMTQQAVYDTLSRMQRQKIHRQAAEYLSKQPDSQRHTLEIASHYVRGGLPPRAMEIVTTAAERAEADGKIEQAIELYTNALELFPQEQNVQSQLDRLKALMPG
jgi:class 3 adenylate cyclase/RecA/RadA recombinase